MSALLSIVYIILAQFTKSRKVDAITWILRNIQDPIKFEPFSDFCQKKTSHILSKVIKNCSAQNLNLAELGAKMSFFSKNSKFYKIQRSNGFFLNSIRNVLEHWSRYKELFSWIAQNLRQLVFKYI